MSRVVVLFWFVIATAVSADSVITVIGDTQMGSHLGKDANVAAALTQILNRPVENRAVSGATYLGTEDLVQDQARTADANIIIASGGLNDIYGHCWDRARVMVLMDRIIYADAGRGMIPRLASELDADVFYVGYLRATNPVRDFVECGGILDLFEARLVALENLNDRFHFVSLADVNPSQDRSFFLADGVTPSARAVQAIAQKIAERLDNMGVAKCGTC